MIPYAQRRYLRGREPRREMKRNRYYAFDIECAGLNPTKPLLICLTPFEKYSNRLDSEYVFKGENCKTDFKTWLDSLPKNFNHIIYAHNGSRFDIYSVFDKWGIVAAEKFERKGRIFYIKYNRSVQFRDSINILQAPLKAFGAKGVTPQKFIDENHPDYGKYEAITQTDIDYCIQDCLVLRDALVEMKSLYGEWVGNPEVELPLSTASMAHRVWTVRYFPDEWRWVRTKGKMKGRREFSTFIDERAEASARNAYYGGRVQVIGEAGEAYDSVISLDCNSMFPTAMLNKFPDPTTTRLSNDLESVRRGGFLYWGKFKLRAGDNSPTFFPSKNEEGRRDYTQRIFEGYLCSPEVEYALENGWVVEEYSDLFYARKSIEPFTDYVKFFYGLRLEMKANDDPRQSLIKLMLNSLYGVFGTKGEQKRIESPNEIAEIFSTGEIDNYEIHFWNAESDSFYLKSKEYSEPPEHTVFQWCAFITSYARISLERAIQSVNEWGRQVVYCDTDSVHFTDFNGSLEGCPLNIGGSLGDWSVESVVKNDIIHQYAQTAIYYEPKVYSWFVTDEPIKIRHKGCSDSTGDPTIPQTNRSVLLYRTALRRQLESGVEIKTVKRSKRWCDS